MDNVMTNETNKSKKSQKCWAISKGFLKSFKKEFP